MIEKFLAIFTAKDFTYIFTNIFAGIFSKRQKLITFENIRSLGSIEQGAIFYMLQFN